MPAVRVVRAAERASDCGRPAATRSGRLTLLTLGGALRVHVDGRGIRIATQGNDVAHASNVGPSTLAPFTNVPAVPGIGCTAHRPSWTNKTQCRWETVTDGTCTSAALDRPTTTGSSTGRSGSSSSRSPSVWRSRTCKLMKRSPR